MLQRYARPALAPVVRWALRRAARAYVAGERVEDAVRVADQLAARGLTATLGYWNDKQDPPRLVADHYLDCIRRCRAGDYVSIKLPAIDHSRVLFDQLAAEARTAGVRLHFDAMQPHTARRLQTFIDALPGEVIARVGVTLPGCWARSPGDADWAVERALPVRVVKGQWPDPERPDIDLREGFLRVVDALAGRGTHVAVATHDAPLARRAFERLAACATHCELELLYGLPRRRALAVAAAAQVRARVYIGYGFSFVPYAVGRLLDDPRRLIWLLRDALGFGAR
jgi:proline dehydrogenase